MTVARCFKCRETIARGREVFGPICGPGEAHAQCADVPWHTGCRQQWLADLEVWDEVAGVAFR